MEISSSSQASPRIKYAPNEKFYQGKTYRIPIQNKFPIFQLNFKASMKDLLGGEYQYQSLTAKITKLFYVAPFGISNWTLEGGRIFGTVPYPLLEFHRANQTFSYQLPAYNLIDYVKRMTYTDLPGVSKWGIRARFKLDF